MRFGLSLTSAPAAEPVTLTEAKNRLRVTVTGDDTDLTALIVECRQMAEAHCGRQFVTATWTLTLDEFPPYDAAIVLPRPPAQSVTHVKYYDADGVQQTWGSANYHASTAIDPGRVTPAYGVSWPATQIGRPEAVEVRFVAGYGNQAAQPSEVKAAVLEILAHRFANRGDSQLDIPPVAKRLLAQLDYGEVR